jgi:hypothetical protein
LIFTLNLLLKNQKFISYFDKYAGTTVIDLKLQVICLYKLQKTSQLRFKLRPTTKKHLSKRFKKRSLYILRQARGKSKRGEKVKFSLKRLNDVLHGFVTKRGRMVRLIVAILAVALLCVILSGLTLIQLTSDYQPSGTNGVTNPNQVAPEHETNSTIPSQPAPNYPTTKTISNVGSLKTIGIGAYWDANLTDKVNWIDWGTLEPGAQKSLLMYFHNEGNSAVTLSESTSNWNPSLAASYLTLSWDYSGQTIEADKNLQVTLTLSVSASITGVTNFSFDIIVVGTG